MKKRITAICVSAMMVFSIFTGCGKTSSDAVPVQSVSAVNGMFGTTQQQLFVGIVSTGNEANIKKDASRRVAKVNVKKGDIVKEGDVLFTYDAQQAKDSLLKAQLELEELKNSIESKKEEKELLEADKQKVKEENQLEYTLKIQSVDTDIREEEFNLGLKENEIKKLENSTKDLDVKAPFEGRIEKVGTADTSITSEAFDLSEEESDDAVLSDESDGSTGETFIKLVETGNYRIKGTINETNIKDIYLEMPMVIHSRTDEDAVWYGTVSDIENKTPQKNTGEDEYGGESADGEMTTTSSYVFYVSIDSLEGLMIGQHVYMSAAEEDVEEGAVILNASFICDAETSPWVWAEKNGVLEKRPVTLDDYDEERDAYYILDGLTMEDFIASPTENLKEGMPVVENDAEAFREYVDSLEDQTNGSNQSAGDESEDEDMSEFDESDEGLDESDYDEEFDEDFEEDFDDSGEDFDAIDFDSADDEIIGEVVG